MMGQVKGESTLFVIIVTNSPLPISTQTSCWMGCLLFSVLFYRRVWDVKGIPSFPCDCEDGYWLTKCFGYSRSNIFILVHMHLGGWWSLWRPKDLYSRYFEVYAMKLFMRPGVFSVLNKLFSAVKTKTFLMFLW